MSSIRRRTRRTGKAGATRARARRVIRLRMESRRSAIAPATERILGELKGAGFSEDQRQDLAVALTEALANAAVHGNKLRPESVVRVEVDVKPGREAAIRVRDSGPGFDSDAVPDPSDPDRILAPAGRGIFLMRQLVDRLEYNDRGNEVRLLVRARPRRAAR